MIADGDRAVGIGGVMGGEETGVSETTRNVSLEAAYFQPASVRRTARTLNLPSDASYRFERGVDAGMVLHASQRAAELMAQLAGGKPAPKIWVAGKLPADPPDIRLRYQRCNQLLGTTVEPPQVDRTLERFGLTKSNAQGEATEAGANWKIPSHRRDLRREVDLIEEVVRVYGVNRIEGSDRSRFTSSSPADVEHDRDAQLRLTLAARGLHEARTSKLIPRNAQGIHVTIKIEPGVSVPAATLEAIDNNRFLQVRQPKNGSVSYNSWYPLSPQPLGSSTFILPLAPFKGSASTIGP